MPVGRELGPEDRDSVQRRIEAMLRLKEAQSAQEGKGVPQMLLEQFVEGSTATADATATRAANAVAGKFGKPDNHFGDPVDIVLANEANQAAAYERYPDASIPLGGDISIDPLQLGMGAAQNMPGMLASGAVAGFPGMMAYFGSSAYEQGYAHAIEANKTEEEAHESGLNQAKIEVGVTTAFQLIGLGGIEKAALRSGAKQAVKKSITKRLMQSGEMIEEGTVAAKKSITKRLAQFGATELTPEIIEEGTISVWQNIETAMSGVDENADDWGSQMQGVIDAAVQTVFTFGMLNGPKLAKEAISGKPLAVDPSKPPGPDAPMLEVQPSENATLETPEPGSYEDRRAKSMSTTPEQRELIVRDIIDNLADGADEDDISDAIDQAGYSPEFFNETIRKVRGTATPAEPTQPPSETAPVQPDPPEVQTVIEPPPVPPTAPPPEDEGDEGDAAPVAPVTPPVPPPPAAPANQAVPPRLSDWQGDVNHAPHIQLMSEGESVLTNEGGVTAPYPKVDVSTDRKAKNTIKRVDDWLKAEAIAEAKRANDDFALLQFQNVDTLQQADRDMMADYIVSSDPDFVRPTPPAPVTRPVTTPEPTTTPPKKTPATIKKPVEPDSVPTPLGTDGKVVETGGEFWPSYTAASGLNNASMTGFPTREAAEAWLNRTPKPPHPDSVVMNPGGPKSVKGDIEVIESPGARRQRAQSLVESGEFKPGDTVDYSVDDGPSGRGRVESVTPRGRVVIDDTTRGKVETLWATDVTSTKPGDNGDNGDNEATLSPKKPAEIKTPKGAIGLNKDGAPVFEDKNGVRTVNGVQESVKLVPSLRDPGSGSTAIVYKTRRTGRREDQYRTSAEFEELDQKNAEKDAKIAELEGRLSPNADEESVPTKKTEKTDKVTFRTLDTGKRVVSAQGKDIGATEFRLAPGDRGSAQRAVPQADIKDDDTIYRIAGIELDEGWRNKKIGREMYLDMLRQHPEAWFYNSQSYPPATRTLESLSRDGLIELHWEAIPGGKDKGKPELGGPHAVRLAKKTPQNIKKPAARSEGSSEVTNKPGVTPQGETAVAPETGSTAPPAFSEDAIRSKIPKGYELVPPGGTAKAHEGLRTKKQPDWHIISPGGFTVGRGDSAVDAYRNAQQDEDNGEYFSELTSSKATEPATDDFAAAAKAAVAEAIAKRDAEKRSGIKKDPPAKPEAEATKKPRKRSEIKKEAATATLETAKAKMEALAKLVGEDLSSGVNPKIMAAVIDTAMEYAKAGVLTFDAYVSKVAEQFSESFARKMAPYMEAGWQALKDAGEVGTDAGKVDDVLGKAEAEPFLSEPEAIPSYVISGFQKSAGEIKSRRNDMRPLGLAVTHMVKNSDGGYTQTISSDAAIQNLADHANNGNVIFLDSGMFGTVSKGEVGAEPDWDAVFKQYDRIISLVEPAYRSMVYIVAPDYLVRTGDGARDIVGDTAKTQELQSYYSKDLFDYQNVGVNLIVPIQRDFTGERSLQVLVADATDYIDVKTGKVSWGIPYNQAAFPDSEILDFVRFQKDQGIPTAIHLLGGGKSRAQKLWDKIKEIDPTVRLTGDSATETRNKSRVKKNVTDSADAKSPVDADTTQGDGDDAGKRPGKIPGKRGGSDGGSVRGPASDGDASAADSGTGRPGVREPAGSVDPHRQPKRSENDPVHNYRIGENPEWMEGGAVTKLNQNTDAIKLLVELESSGALATPEQQDVLAKFTGWGHLKQFFNIDREILAELGAQDGDSWNFDALDKIPAKMAEVRRADGAKAGEESALVERRIKREAATDKHRVKLMKMLPPKEYFEARRSTQYSHYTDPGVTSLMWEALSALGIPTDALHVLDPSEGSGIFTGTIPDKLAKIVRMTGIDVDSTSIRIARQLYQGHRHIQQPFQSAVLADGWFDVAMSNFPFQLGSVIVDTQNSVLSKAKLSLHNYFFGKSGSKLRPGGLVLGITTHFTMDSLDGKARKAINDQGLRFVGAVRLPSNAFGKIAKTAVTTDIIIMQKMPEGYQKQEGDFDWLQARKVELPGGEMNDMAKVPLSSYFAQHPENVLGQLRSDGSMRSKDAELTVRSTHDNLFDVLGPALTRAMEGVDKQLYREGAKERQAFNESTKGAFVDIPESAKTAGIGSIVLDGDRLLMRHSEDQAEVVDEDLKTGDGKKRKKVEGWIRLRDSARAVRDAQVDPNVTDKQLRAMRKELNDAYDALLPFVKIPGQPKPSLAAMSQKTLFYPDYDFPSVAALENVTTTYKDVKGKDGEVKQKKIITVTKGDIFTERTDTPTQIMEVNSPLDMVRLSLFSKGQVDPEYIAEITGATVEEIENQIREYAFELPSGGWDINETYLSGNIPKKIAEAKEAAQGNSRFKRNLEALKEVLPKDKTVKDIKIEIGAPFLDPSHYETFVRETFRATAPFTKGPDGGGGGFLMGRVENKNSAENRSAYGVVAREGRMKPKQIYGTDIFDRILHGKELRVTYTINKKSFDDKQATKEMIQRAKQIKNAFQNWLHTEEKRSKQILEKYNRTINGFVEPKAPEWAVSMDGLNPKWKNQMMPHQKAGAARIAFGTNTMLAHRVGYGKTASVILGLSEQRRMGVSRKPAIVVPNHLIGQWADTILEMYPSAKLLAPAPTDFSPAKRQTFLARAATNNWDFIVIPESSFGKMPMSPAYTQTFFSKMLSELEAAIRAEKATAGRGPTLSEMEAKRELLEGKMRQRIADMSKDPGPYFDDLGIDSLSVDEAHHFKNLWFITSATRTPGITSTGNDMTFDMLMKTDYINSISGGRNVTFATGTPISNSMVEAWVMMRYLIPEQMKAAEVYAFDNWKNAFGEVVQLNRVDPIGRGFRIEDRFNEFRNLQSLFRLYSQMADIKMTVSNVKTPPIHNGKVEIVEVAATPQMKELMLGLANRASTANDVEDDVDIILKIMSDGSKAAMDMRLLSGTIREVNEGKLHSAAKEIKQIYDDSNSFKGTQLVWSDLGVPKKPKKIDDKMVKLGQWMIDATEAITIDELKVKWKEIDQGKTASARLLRFLRMTEQDFHGVEGSEGDSGSINLGTDEEPNWISSIDGVDANITNPRAPKWNTYQELKDMLVESGIPENEIAFIHDYNTPQEKSVLFSMMNSGEMRVLLGSTQKLGTGANVQKRLIAMHHLDAPWRPADIEQREGRAKRQGNKSVDMAIAAGAPFNGIRILRYVMGSSIDARYWQTLEDKAANLEQFYSGKGETIGDLGSNSASFADMKAAAVSNPDIRRQLDVRTEVAALVDERDLVIASTDSARREIAALEAGIPVAENKLAMAVKYDDQYDAYTASLPKDSNFSIKMADGTVQPSSKEGAAAIIDALTAIGREMAVKQIDATFVSEHSANMSDWITVGNVGPWPLNVQVRAGWRNVKTGETLAGNTENLKLRRDMADKADWEWAFHNASFRVGGDTRSGSKGLGGNAMGNISKIRNAMKAQYNQGPGMQKQIDGRKQRIAKLQDVAKQVFEKNDEMAALNAELEDLNQRIGEDADDEVSFFVMSKDLIDYLGKDENFTQFMIERTDHSLGHYIGKIEDPNDGSEIEVYSSDPRYSSPTQLGLGVEAEPSRPPRGRMVYLDPGGYIERDDDGQVMGQKVEKPTPPKPEDGLEQLPGEREMPMLKRRPDQIKSMQNVRTGPIGESLDPVSQGMPDVTRNRDVGLDRDKIKSTSAQDIVKSLGHIFNATMRVGGFSRAAAGLYRYLSEVVRLSKQDAANIAVAVHEVAHHIDKVTQTTMNADRDVNPDGHMPTHLQNRIAGLDYDLDLVESAEGRPEEGWSEFIRIWMTLDPDVYVGLVEESVMKEATEYLEGPWKARNPVMFEKLEQAKRLVKRYSDQSVFERITSAIHDQPASRLDGLDRQVADELVGFAQQTYTDWNDRLYPLSLLDKAAEAAGIDRSKVLGAYEAAMGTLNTAPTMAEKAIRHGVFLTTDREQTVGNGFSEQIRGLSRRERREADAYMVAKHVVDIQENIRDKNGEIRSPKYKTPIELEDAKRLIAAIEGDKAKFAKYKALDDAMRAFNNDLLKMLEDAGVITADDHIAMLQAYGENGQFYLPMHRVSRPRTLVGKMRRVFGQTGFLDMSYFSAGQSSSSDMTKVNKPIKGRSKTGSDRQILSPVYATLDRAQRFYAAANQQLVWNQLIRQVDPQFGGAEGLGGYAARIDPKMRMTTAVFKEILDNLEDEGIISEDERRAMDIRTKSEEGKRISEEDVDWLIDHTGAKTFKAAVALTPNASTVFQIYRPDYYGTAASAANVTYQIVGGKKLLYEINPLIYQSLKGMHPAMQNVMVQMIGEMTKVFKFFTVGVNTAFSIRNFIMDIRTGTAQSKHMGPAERIYASAMHGILYGVSQAHDTVNAMTGNPNRSVDFNEGYRLYRENGGEQQHKLAGDISSKEKFLRQYNPSAFRNFSLAAGLEKARAINTWSDVGPRYAEFLASLRGQGYVLKGGKFYSFNPATGKVGSQLSPKRMEVIRAINAAADVTYNFKRVGYRTMVLEQGLPFTNAAIQGTDKQIRSIGDSMKGVAGLFTGDRNKEGERAAAGLAFTIGSTVVIASLVRASFDDDEWQEIKDYMKRYLYMSKTNEQGNVEYALPESREYAALAHLTHAIYDSINMEDPKDNNLVDNVSEVVVEDLRQRIPSGGGFLTSIYDLLKNEDWMGAEIEKTWWDRDHVPKSERYGPSTKELSKLIGSAVSEPTGMSPAQIEYLIDESTGSGYGRMHDQLKSAVTGSFSTDNLPYIKGLWINRHQAQSISDMFNRIKELEEVKGGEDYGKRKMTAEESRELAKIEIYREMFTAMSKRGSDLKDDDEKAKLTQFRTGIARDAIGRSESDANPSPLDIDPKDWPEFMTRKDTKRSIDIKRRHEDGEQLNTEDRNYILAIKKKKLLKDAIKEVGHDHESIKDDIHHKIQTMINTAVLGDGGGGENKEYHEKWLVRAKNYKAWLDENKSSPLVRQMRTQAMLSKTYFERSKKGTLPRF